MRPSLNASKIVGIPLVVFVVALCVPGMGYADFIVAPGWDLYQTTSANFGGVTFDGVPIGNFNFTGVGVRNTGNTDTIIHRLDQASAPPEAADPTAAMQFEALQLRSTSPVLIMGVPTTVFITLSASAQPTGSINIAFANQTGGTFSGSVPFNYDLRSGALDGPILFSSSGAYSWTNATWGEDAGANFTIDGVNHFLKGNGTDDQDFFAGSSPQLELEAVPEPALAMTTCLAVVGMALMSAKRRFWPKKSEAATSVVG